jgi:hydrogenase expression/formation protein HypC
MAIALPFYLDALEFTRPGGAMCLAVPMKLTEVSNDGSVGKAEHEGATYDVNLMMIECPREQEYVVVHAGCAIEKIDEDEARIRLELFEEIVSIMDSQGK